jgi:hypothetical protein
MAESTRRYDVTKKKGLKTTGSTNGKSNAKGMGGQSQQLLNEGVPAGVVGNLARKAGTAPGGKFYHNPSGKKKGKGGKK